MPSSNAHVHQTTRVRVGDMDDVIGEISLNGDGQVSFSGDEEGLQRLYESIKRQRLYRGLSDAQTLAQMCRLMRGSLWAKDISDEGENKA